jgi:hypothetical protein
MIVKIIDRDGDLATSGPDKDSDIYVVDWHADGSINTVVAYADVDGDRDVDEMMSFYRQGGNLLGWFARDVGDDNRLWHLTDYIYTQEIDEFLSDFNGDELFVQYEYSSSEKRWKHRFEDPFLFYDNNRDGFSDQVVRYSTKLGQLKSIRYSADLALATTADHPHLYNFSLTMLAGGNIGTETDRPWSGLVDESHVFAPFLRWEEGRTRLSDIPITDVEFLWVEDDNNTCNGSRPRWEGVLNFVTPFFPQVGGCNEVRVPLNRRHEIVRNNRAPVQLYFSTADGKLHLFNAGRAWLDVDYDQDGQIDMKYTYVDTNLDGFLDRMLVDVDNDNATELAIRLDGPRTFWNGFADWQALRTAYLTHASVQDVRSQSLTPLLKRCVRKLLNQPRYIDAAEKYFQDELVSFRGDLPHFGPRMRNSAQTQRFYREVGRDRYVATLASLLQGTERHETLRLYEIRDDAALVTFLTPMCGP